MLFLALFFKDSELGNICFAKNIGIQPSNIELVAHVESDNLKQFTTDDLDYFEYIREKINSEFVINFNETEDCYQKTIEIHDREWEYFFSLHTFSHFWDDPRLAQSKKSTLMGKNKIVHYEIKL